MSRRSAILVGIAPMLFLIGAVTLALLGFEAARAAGTATTVTITVTAGKPSEFKFTLSKKTAPAGTVVFKVFNRGKKPHNFVIGSKRTPTIAPGKSATLIVVFAKAGSVVYRSSLKGQASMRGVFAVTKAITTTTTTPVVLPCPNPATTTVNVGLSEFAITLSQSSIPCGTATFSLTNTGAVNHNFSVGGGTSAVLAGGTSGTLTVTFPQPGSFTYICTQGNHAGQGMVGSLTVT
jgi:plastocyanin